MTLCAFANKCVQVRKKYDPMAFIPDVEIAAEEPKAPPKSSANEQPTVPPQKSEPAKPLARVR